MQVEGLGLRKISVQRMVEEEGLVLEMCIFKASSMDLALLESQQQAETRPAKRARGPENQDPPKRARGPGQTENLDPTMRPLRTLALAAQMLDVRGRERLLSWPYNPTGRIDYGAYNAYPQAPPTSSNEADWWMMSPGNPGIVDAETLASLFDNDQVKHDKTGEEDKDDVDHITSLDFGPASLNIHPDAYDKLGL